MMLSSNATNGRFLPPNWEQAIDPASNRYYYVDHNSKTTTWLNPLDQEAKPEISQCIGDQLPYGWERIIDPVIGVYYADHIERKNQWDNPVLVWQRRLMLLDQHHYSNSHHILATTKEQSAQFGNSLDSNNQTQTASPSTTATGKQDISLRASACSDIEKSATSLNNSNTLDLDMIGLTRSNNSTREDSRGFDASLLDIMEICFGRESSQSVEV